MTVSKLTKIAVIFLLLTSMIPITNAQTSSVEENPQTVANGARRETITVKLVFGGFEEQIINPATLFSYLPEEHTNDVITSYPPTTYVYDYQAVTLTSDYVQALKDYIQSIAIVGEDIGYRVNHTLLEQFLVDHTTDFVYPIDGMAIDARNVESFIAENFGAIHNITGPVYTLYMFNYSCFDSFDHSTEHYYYINGSATEEGLSVEWRVGSQEFTELGPTVGWGGNYRFAYLDLSATSAYLNAQPAWYGIDMSNLLAQRYDLDEFCQVYDIYSPEGNALLHEYIAEWANAFLDTLIPGGLLDEPPVDTTYSLPIVVYNNLTPVELYNDELIGSLLHADAIEASFENSFPWTDWQCYINLHRLEDEPLMDKLIKQYVKMGELPDGYGTGLYLQIMDGFLQYLAANFSQFIPKSQIHDTTIPCFIFIGDFSFFYYQTRLGGGGVGRDGIVIISQWSRHIASDFPIDYLVRHEVGHILGLAHPHNENVGFLACFVEDPMSYFSDTISRNFSVFSRDNLGRLHFDAYFENATQKFDTIAENYCPLKKPHSLEDMYEDIESKLSQSYEYYEAAEYYDAIITIRDTISLMDTFANKMDLLITFRQPYVIVPIVLAGLAILGTGGFYISKRIIVKSK